MLRRVARAAVDAIGRPVDELGRRPDRGASVVVLIYHRSPSPVDLPLEMFLEQLDRLADSGRVIALEEAIELLGAGNADDRTHVAITFDDGTEDWVDLAMPALAERSLPATFYVSTDFVERGLSFPDRGRPVSWAGLTEMHSTGLATIGSHTHTHRVFANADAQVAADEVGRSQELIEDRLDVPCRHFAYPKAIAPAPAAEVLVRRRFDSAVLAGNRLNVAGDNDVHRLGRHAITNSDDAELFARKISGGCRLEGALREARDARRTPASDAGGQ
jgi:peptidoglycan/xylan/chitin deacetylase (PgdA/CDA1 family)